MSASSAWVDLRISPDELRIEHVLNTDQTFAWERTGENVWTGVVGRNVISLKSTNSTTCAKAHSGTLSCLDEYFQKSESLKKLYKNWSSKLARVRDIAKYVPGCRVLRQDPWEVLVTLLIPRCGGAADIGEIVSDLREKYGSPLYCIKDQVYYAFPSVADLSQACEESLRDIGFGQRVKLILKLSKAIEQRGGEVFLRGLRQQTVEKTREILMSLPGIVLKMADTIALYALDKSSVVPVDMRVHRVLKRYFPAAIPAQDGKSLLRKDFLSRRMYDNIVEAIREKLGDKCGWALTVLLAAETPAVQETLPESLQTEETDMSPFVGVTESRYCFRRTDHGSWDDSSRGKDGGNLSLAKAAVSSASSTPRSTLRHNAKDRAKDLGDSTTVKATAAALVTTFRHFSRKKCASEDARSAALQQPGTSDAVPQAPPHPIASSFKEPADVTASPDQPLSRAGRKTRDKQLPKPPSSSRTPRPAKVQSKRLHSPVSDGTRTTSNSGATPKIRHMCPPSIITAPQREVKRKEKTLDEATKARASNRRTLAVPNGLPKERKQEDEGETTKEGEEKDEDEKPIQGKVAGDNTAADAKKNLKGKNIKVAKKTRREEKEETMEKMDEAKKEGEDDADEESEKEGEGKNEESGNEESAKKSTASHGDSGSNEKESKKSKSDGSDNESESESSSSSAPSIHQVIPLRVAQRNLKRQRTCQIEAAEKEKRETLIRRNRLEMKRITLVHGRGGHRANRIHSSDSDLYSTNEGDAGEGFGQTRAERVKEAQLQRLMVPEDEATQARRRMEEMIAGNPLLSGSTRTGDAPRTPARQRGRRPKRQDSLMASAKMPRPGRPAGKKNVHHSDSDSVTVRLSDEERGVMKSTDPRLRPWPWNAEDDGRKTPSPEREWARDKTKVSSTPSGRRRARGSRAGQESIEGAIARALSCPGDLDFDDDIDSGKDPTFRIGGPRKTPIGGSRKTTPSGRRRGRPPKGTRPQHQRRQMRRSKSSDSYSDHDSSLPSAPRKRRKRRATPKTIQSPSLSPSSSTSQRRDAHVSKRAAATEDAQTLERGATDAATSGASASPTRVAGKTITKSPVATSYAQWKRRRARATQDRSPEDPDGKDERWRKRQKTSSRNHDSEEDEQEEDEQEEDEDQHSRKCGVELKPLMARSREERMMKRDFQRRLEEAKSASGAELSSSVSTTPLQNTSTSLPHQGPPSSLQTPADTACAPPPREDERQYTKEGLRKPRDRLFIDPDRSGASTQPRPAPPQNHEGSLKAQKRSDTIATAQYDSDDEPLQNAFIGWGKPQLISDDRPHPRRRLASVDGADSTLPHTSDTEEDGRQGMRKQRSPAEYTKEGIRKPRNPEKERLGRPSGAPDNIVGGNKPDNGVLPARDNHEKLKHEGAMEGESRCTQAENGESKTPSAEAPRAEEVRVDCLEATPTFVNEPRDSNGTPPTPEQVEKTPTRETAYHSPPQEAPLSGAATTADGANTTITASEQAASMDTHARSNSNMDTPAAPGVSQPVDALSPPARTGEEASPGDAFVPDNAQSGEFADNDE